MTDSYYTDVSGVIEERGHGKWHITLDFETPPGDLPYVGRMIGWDRYGRKRAEAKARREIRRWRRESGRQAFTVEVPRVETVRPNSTRRWGTA